MSCSRRDMLNLGAHVVAGAIIPGIVQAAPTQGPQPGDAFVSVTATGKTPLQADAIQPGAAPTLAWPMERATGYVRSGARLNQVLLLRVAIIHDAVGRQAEEQLLAFSAICPHAGCLVSEWIAPTGHLHCPCHGSEYDPAKSGEVIAGPAPQPLPMLSVAAIDGLVVVAGGFSTPPGGHTSRTM